MTIRVRHKNDDSIAPIVYENVEDVIDTFDDNGNYCHTLLIQDGSQATFPACEWELWRRTWTRMF